MPAIPSTLVEESTGRLKEQLAAAMAAAGDAYRQTSRLIRVLSVLGEPSSPSELVEQTLTVLSQIFAADVTATARVMAGRLVVTNSCGIPEGDPAYSVGWPLVGAAAEAVAGVRPLARAGDQLDAAVDVPASLSGIALNSAAWVPIGSTPDTADELLLILRQSPESFSPTELQILGSVASRLRLAVEARERGVAAERLAKIGHQLASTLDLPALHAEAVALLPQLVCADGAILMAISDRTGTLRASTGLVGPPLGWSVTVDLVWGWDAAVQGEPYRGEQEVNGAPNAVLGVPIIRDGQPTAVLYAFRADRRPFLADATESAAIFANYVGAAITNAELYQALRDSESSLRLITDSISDLVAVVDADGRFVYASPSHERELAHPPTHLVGTAVTALAHPDDRADLAAALTDPAGSPKVEYRMRSGRGHWVWVESALRPAPSPDDTLVLSSRVIDERRRFEEELRRRATHDPLTNLANRTLVAEHLDTALVREDPSHVGVLFCDLDKFKEVNDRLGHEAGDALLLQVADRLRHCARQHDLLARFGGDEFVMVLDGVRDLGAITEIGDRVVRTLEEPFLLGREQVEISVSVGGVLGVRGQASTGEMLRDADAAMYAAKNNGRGRVEVFDRNASRNSLRKLELRSDLHLALLRHELSVRYQPIVALETGEILGFEALARWHHPQHGPIAPDVFIPLAEETGAIVAIGDWVLGEACRQLSEWQRLPGCAGLGMSVNLSAVQAVQPDAAVHTLKIIHDTGVAPVDVWLEITEGGAIGAGMADFAVTLRASGVHFALDDFGTSYSNVGRLKRLPVEVLKIDRSFVADLAEQETDRGIVRAVLAAADSLGLTVVAKGVETARQWAELRALGCTHGQGYLFSRPLPASEATELIA